MHIPTLLDFSAVNMSLFTATRGRTHIRVLKVHPCARFSPCVTGLEHGPGRKRMPSVRWSRAFVWAELASWEDMRVAWLDPREERTCAQSEQILASA